MPKPRTTVAAAAAEHTPGWFNEPGTPTSTGLTALLMESISQSAVDVLVEAGFEVECVHKLSEEQLLEKVRTASVLGVRSKTKVTKAVLDAAEELLAVGCFCIGTDQTDLEEAAVRGVPVFNAPFANTRSVAEMVLAEIIVLARQIGDRNSECHRGVWNKQSKGCYEVRGKTLGIVGYGHVGSQLSVLAESLGLAVVFHDIVTKMPLGNARAAASLDQVLREAHFLSVHVPGTPATENLIGAEELARMRPGSYLINASRGRVVNVDAAADAIRSGHLAGGAFDVFPKEPASRAEEFKSPLVGLPNVVLTPHIGGSTEEAQAAIGAEVARKLVAFARAGSTEGAVNLPEVSLPLDDSSSVHRLINVHRNVPGVLRAINEILSVHNVTSQVLRTRGPVGIIVLDLDSAASRKARIEIDELADSICTRIIQ